jgi:hypothetical protein
MGAAIAIRDDYSAVELRRFASRAKNVNQSRRLLSLAAAVEGMRRGDAARIGGMDRQTLRDWVHRFNAEGPDGLKDHWANGSKPRLSVDQRAERSCPYAWCSFSALTFDSGTGRVGQAATADRLTRGSSLKGAMVSRVM